MVLGIPNFKKTTYLFVPLSFFKGQRPPVSMRRAGQKVSVSYSLTSSFTRVGCTVGLGELEQHIAAHSILRSTTDCKQNYVPLSFSKGQTICFYVQGWSESFCQLFADFQLHEGGMHRWVERT